MSGNEDGRHSCSNNIKSVGFLTGPLVVGLIVDDVENFLGRNLVNFFYEQVLEFPVLAED